MLLKTHALVACLLLVPASFLQAQADEESTKHLRRFISEQTLMVGHLDLRRLDVPALFEMLQNLKLPVKNELEQGKALLMKIKADLAQAGVERLCLIYNQSALDEFPLLYAPIKDQAQAETVATLLAYGQAGPFSKQPSWLTPRRETAWKVVDNYVFVGSPASLQALTESKPVERPEFLAAAKVLKDSSVQLLFLPNADLRKIVTETLPQFPKELGGGSTASLAKGIEWAVVTGSLPPQLQGRLFIQTDQPAQTQELQQLWQAMLSNMKKGATEPGASSYFKAFQLIVESMTVTVKDRQFTVEASSDRLAGIVKILSQSLPQLSGNDLNASQLRNFVIAMHNFHNDYNRLPNQAICDKDGKPLLSWRVAMLPYLDQGNLYKQFKLDEPWDSEHNKKLIEKMPKIYSHPFAKNVPANHTLYQVFYSKQGAKPAAAIMETGKMTLGMLTVQDGTSNTFLVTDAAAEAVPWTKPADLLYNGKVENLPKLVSPRGDGWAHVAFGDGHTARFKPSGSPKLLWQMIGRNDGANEDNTELFGNK